MIVLAFDTALAACTAGVWRDGTVVASQSLMTPQGHAEALMPMIERVMTAAGIDYASLDRIAVTVGPGSFTGLRVGIATARGLAMAAHKPAIGVSTTESLAAAVPVDERHDAGVGVRRVLSVVDSKRDDVFAQAFTTDGRPDTNILNLGYDALADAFTGPLVVVGDAAQRAVASLGPQAVVSNAPATCTVAQIALIASTRPIDPRGPLPVYVRAPDVTLRPGGGALRP
jgi:tRNA threonylcarbamoyladenosine biosynthesis protein TsaB